MKSFSGMSWKMSIVPERLIHKNQQDYNISYLLSKIFLQRNFSNDEIFYSLHKYKSFNFEYKNDDLINAADLLNKSIETNTTRLGLKPGASNALSLDTINCKPSKNVKRIRDKCWYAPLEDDEILKIAYKWALSQSVTSVLPPGEFDLWKKALEIVMDFKPINDEELKILKDCSENKLPLFTL